MFIFNMQSGREYRHFTQYRFSIWNFNAEFCEDRPHEKLLSDQTILMRYRSEAQNLDLFSCHTLCATVFAMSSKLRRFRSSGRAQLMIISARRMSPRRFRFFDLISFILLNARSQSAVEKGSTRTIEKFVHQSIFISSRKICEKKLC